MLTDSQFIHSEFTIIKDICEAGIPDYGRIWIVHVLCFAIHSNRPNTLCVLALRGVLIPGVQNAEQCSMVAARWLGRAQVTCSRTYMDLKMKSVDSVSC